MRYKKKSNELMRNIKDTMSIGIGSSVGIGVLGKIGGMVPGGAASGATKLAQSSLTLTNLGSLSKTSKSIMKQFK